MDPVLLGVLGVLGVFVFKTPECLGHFNGIVPSLACILTKQHGVCGGKYFLKSPANTISETLNYKMSLDASAIKNLCFWCKFQSRLLFIISLLLFDSPFKNILTALIQCE